MVSKAQFDKAVQIINGLPKDGPIRPTQDMQLQVSPLSVVGSDILSFTAITNKLPRGTIIPPDLVSSYIPLYLHHWLTIRGTGLCRESQI
jgi:hypothetical protein